MSSAIPEASAMEYRKIFVRFTRAKGSSIVNVTNDGWFIGNFYSNALTENEFIEDCEKYTETDEFKKAMRIIN